LSAVSYVVAASLLLSASMAARAQEAQSNPAQEMVYVANAGSGPVTAYRAGSRGAVSPVRRLRNPHNPNTFWDPWGIAFDHAGNAYIQSFLSDATSFVFPPRSSTPTRIFRVAGPDLESIAVDGQGYEYVMGGQGPPVVSVAAPGARGNPSNLYFVSPLRQIESNRMAVTAWPSTLTADNHNHILIVAVYPTGNAIEAYDGGPSGTSFPVRTISGPDTGLGACPRLAECDHVAITYSPRTGQIYAAVSGATATRLLVFAGGASGDALPLRTIAGSRTGLEGKVVTGIAVSQRSGDAYVLAKSAQVHGPGVVELFGRAARGNRAPLRGFTDNASRLANGQGIAVNMSLVGGR
jgi:hypothetical protein